jgi:predicted nucleotidyltransferase component of viral defense system
MKSDEFKDFRLVGGTALSLQIGHRISVDIDLFTDLDYGKVDFNKIEKYLKDTFKYVDSTKTDLIGFGKSFFVGETDIDSIKIDVYYTDHFISEYLLEEGIRLATIEEIIAMKIDVIQRKGRKKDFWDLHELIHDYSLEKMLEFHLKRYPYSHDRQLTIQNLTNFANANDDFDPICLKYKYWEIIKLDFIDFVKFR